MQRLSADGSLSSELGEASLGLRHEAQGVEQSFDVIVLVEFFDSYFNGELGTLAIFKKFEVMFLNGDRLTFRSFCHNDF